MTKLAVLEKRIYLIRGERVMLDSDLAELYGVETKRLNEQVRRNESRFPADFMFQLTKEEDANLKSQFATSSWEHGGKRKQPLVFTENGVAMLSSVLASERAIQVNIAIMRTFTKLRSYFALGSHQMERIEQETTHMFKIVFERLDWIERAIKPDLNPKRRKIGLKAWVEF